MKFQKLIFVFIIIVILFINGCTHKDEISELENETVILTKEVDNVRQFIRQVQSSNKSLYEYEVDLQEIPELSYRNVSELSIGENYICYEDTLIIGNVIYKKKEGRYIKQELTLNSLFDIADGLTARCMQYKNLIITVAKDGKSFLIYDMDSDLKYNYSCMDEDMYIGAYWYVYDGCIFYSEWDTQYIKKRTLRQINLLNGDDKMICKPDNEKEEGCVFGKFRIRNDGTIIYEIYDKTEGCREYWIIETDENGKWKEQKVWETKEWEYAYALDFNQYGLVMFGEFYYPQSVSSYYEIVVIKDNGEIEKINNGSKGKYLFMDNGYFWSDAVTLENMQWDKDEVLSEYLTDSVSFYDYDGNKLNTYQMVSKSLLKQGYYLKKLIYSEGKLTGFYVQKETEELYISQINVDLE